MDEPLLKITLVPGNTPAVVYLDLRGVDPHVAMQGIFKSGFFLDTEGILRAASQIQMARLK